MKVTSSRFLTGPRIPMREDDNDLSTAKSHRACAGTGYRNVDNFAVRPLPDFPPPRLSRPHKRSWVTQKLSAKMCPFFLDANTCKYQAILKRWPVRDKTGHHRGNRTQLEH